MSSPEIKPCRCGVVFALGIEAAGLEDLLSGLIKIRGHGFVIKEGGLKGRRVVIVRSGANQKNAARAVDMLIDGHRPKIVISAGFAGGLSPAIGRYDILVADSVIDATGGQISLHNEGQPLKHLKDWPKLHVGKLLTLDRVVRKPDEKQALYEQHQAMALDMETYAVAEVCRERGVPLYTVRVILDAVDDALPPDVQRLLDQKTEAARLGAALGAVWRRPASIKDLWALKEKSLIASDRLAKFIERLIEENV
jgi:adenosylhomocysteine nucleosidase